VNRLEAILETTRRELARRKQQKPIETLRRAPGDEPRGFAAALRADGLSVIAEIKRRSPSAGTIREAVEPAAQARLYESGGAAALSVLTDGPHFGGALDDLRAARAATRLPVLRKDFILDAYQVHEAHAAGADAVLLIVRALPQERLRELLRCCEALGLDALVEVHDAAEIDAALEAGARVVGVNNRDLTTFEVHIERCIELIERIPAGVVRVAESGIATPGDAARIRAAGYDAVLVGEALMRADDPAGLIAGMKGAAS